MLYKNIVFWILFSSGQAKYCTIFIVDLIILLINNMEAMF